MWKEVLMLLNPYLDDIKWDLNKMKVHAMLWWDHSYVTDFFDISRSFCHLWGSVSSILSDTAAEELQAYPAFWLLGHLDSQVVWTPIRILYFGFSVFGYKTPLNSKDITQLC